MTPANASASILAGAALLCGAHAHATTTWNLASGNSQSLRQVNTNHLANSAWAERQFAELLDLRDRWHEFDADPLQLKTITQLRALLSTAGNNGDHVGHIVPGADGSLQAEWHLDNVIVGALVEDDGTYSAWARFIDNGSQVEEFGLNSVDFLRSLAVAFRLDV